MSIFLILLIAAALLVFAGFGLIGLSGWADDDEGEEIPAPDPVPAGVAVNDHAPDPDFERVLAEWRASTGLRDVPLLVSYAEFMDTVNDWRKKEATK